MSYILILATLVIVGWIYQLIRMRMRVKALIQKGFVVDFHILGSRPYLMCDNHNNEIALVSRKGARIISYSSIVSERTYISKGNKWLEFSLNDTSSSVVKIQIPNNMNEMIDDIQRTVSAMRQSMETSSESHSFSSEPDAGRQKCRNGTVSVSDIDRYFIVQKELKKESGENGSVFMDSVAEENK